MDISQTTNNNVSWKFLIPYKIISVFFAALALLTFLSVISLSLRHLFASAVMYAAYVGLNGILAYGFWKMRKWIVPLSGVAALVVTIMNIIDVSRGTQVAGKVLIGFAILCALFVFTYSSRNFLEGEYRNLKALGLFLAFLILSQAATFFLK